MIKSLIVISSLLLFLTFVSCKVGDGPCTKSNQVAIKNKGTDIYLAMQRRRVVLNHLEQTWCLNDESTKQHNVLNKLEGKSFSNVVLYIGNSEFVLDVLEGILTNSVLTISSLTSKVPDTAIWSINYLESSQTVSIRTKLENNEMLALSARSLEASEGVTLKPFDETDVLQQWLIEPLVSSDYTSSEKYRRKSKNN